MARSGTSSGPVDGSQRYRDLLLFTHHPFVPASLSAVLLPERCNLRGSFHTKHSPPKLKGRVRVSGAPVGLSKQAQAALRKNHKKAHGPKTRGHQRQPVLCYIHHLKLSVPLLTLCTHTHTVGFLIPIWESYGLTDNNSAGLCSSLAHVQPLRVSVCP